MNVKLKKTATASISSGRANHLSLGGTLNFDTVPALVVQAKGMLSHGSETTVSLADVDSANSAGLALLLEMLRYSRSINTSIRFEQVPAKMATVARAYGIEPALDSDEFVKQA